MGPTPSCNSGCHLNWLSSLSSNLNLFQNNLPALKYVGTAGPKKWEHSTILYLLQSETEIRDQYFSPDQMKANISFKKSYPISLSIPS